MKHRATEAHLRCGMAIAVERRPERVRTEPAADKLCKTRVKTGSE
ncbi:hypothetical protein USDA257_c08510 [Sinorhizobium fredii USDA 257]|uniref:Uncharacterized protein n=1 Tax=Sinorhizobium fredii (strain USDA 257) TaxID=1185652 RepID=I3X0N7_SINF2|nr:hypothetical protein USDA257_c08510 [Sinorhizobium fredii USDA 257]